jgi:methylglutaconyl-CoA hydratase
MLNLKRIEIEIKDKQLTVWLNQPDIRNALNLATIEELIKAFRWINEQKKLMVILIRGRGKSFCSGADLNWMKNSGSLGYKKCYRDSRKLALCFKLISQSDKVVINLVHGNIFGGGLGFIGAGDLTLALKDSSFCLPEIRLGLVPSVIMPYLLTRVKPADLKYHVFNSEKFSADEAHQMGLIDKVCKDTEEMEHRAEDLIRNICIASPGALTETKRLFRKLNRSLINSDSIKKTVKTLTMTKMSVDAQGRMTKFLSKH